MTKKQRKRVDIVEIFEKEFNVVEKAELLLKEESLASDKLRDNYQLLLDQYKHLLKQSIKLTKIGDATQNKLIKIQQQLDKANADLANKNKELLVKNQELANKNDELIRSKEELILSYLKVEQIFTALSDILPGTLLDGKYRIESKIGSGGFGVVYRAIHITMERAVAVKIFRPSSGNITPEGLQRFRLEAVSMCRVNHPNAISVLDSAVSDSGIAYIVMELLEGHTLTEELRRHGMFSLKRCAEIIIPVCDVLIQAHAAGIIHRDIKPDNIFLHYTQDGEVVKVVDFGIAKLMDEDANFSTLTRQGSVIGTPAYMSPERLNNMPFDGQSDVYSVGIVLYKMLSGKLPFFFEKTDVMSVIIKILSVLPEPLRQANPLVPESIEELVMQTLVRNPIQRPTPKKTQGEISQRAC